MGCLKNEDFKTPKTQLKYPKTLKFIWLTLGLNLVFRPRVSQSQHIYPMRNEDVLPHVEHGSPSFTLKQVVANNGLELCLRVTQKTNFRPSVSQIDGFGLLFRVFGVLGL